jgi:hypothetical protein
LSFYNLGNNLTTLFFDYSFLLSDEIGNGSFGRVYQGFDNDHGLIMAVKQVPITNLSTTQQKQDKVRLMTVLIAS